ncbi:MAG: class I SAM-dependent methyltransferase [Chloroflexota bacterium]
MDNQMIPMTNDLYNYLLSVSLRESELMARLREETASIEGAGMLLSPDSAQFLGFLARLIGAKKTLEIGVFTGYSALAVASALPPDGQIVACDVSEQWTSIGRRYWDMAGVADKIDLRLGPALDTLKTLIDDGQQDQFDFAFIDADKTNYSNYVDLCWHLLRPSGLIVIDNVLWDGAVIDEAYQDELTVAIRALNQKNYQDDRFDLSLVSIGDGMTLLRKR